MLDSKDKEIEYLKSENDLLRASVDILSRDIAHAWERSRGAEYVEARAERIDAGIYHAVESMESFASRINNHHEKVTNIYDEMLDEIREININYKLQKKPEKWWEFWK